MAKQQAKINMMIFHFNYRRLQNGTLLERQNRIYRRKGGGYNTEKWADSFLNGGTCMLDAGHEGDHVFTPDDEITITFD